jgi:hypothetical protein
MIRRSTAVVLVLFLMLLGVAWYLTANNRLSFSAAATPTFPPAPKRLLNVDESQLATLQIQNLQGQVVSMGRDAQSGWSLLEPKATGDPNKIQSVVADVLGLSSQADLGPGMDAGSVGLTAPSFRIILTLTDGSQQIITVGANTPVGSGVYIRVNDGPVQVAMREAIQAATTLVSSPPILATVTPTGGPATVTAGAPISATLTAPSGTPGVTPTP